MAMNREKAAYKEGFVSVLANFGLFGLKMWAGIVSGSIALIADAWHTLSDSLSSVIVIVGVKLSSRKPDREHPFGHGRWEQISAIFIGVLLAIIAFDLVRDAIVKVRGQGSADFGTTAIVVTCISIAAKEGLARYAFYLGKKTENLSVKADGWHHRTDALSSVLVLAGIFLSSRFWWIDSALGILIALMLFYAAFQIVRGAISSLLGEKPSPELIEKVETLIRKACSDDIRPHHYHLHNYINHKELTFHIKLDNQMDIYTGHRLSTKIEDLIREELNIHATIHIEPLNGRHDSD